jgi:hypothetical protein
MQTPHPGLHLTPGESKNATISWHYASTGMRVAGLCFRNLPIFYDKDSRETAENPPWLVLTISSAILAETISFIYNGFS